MTEPSITGPDGVPGAEAELHGESGASGGESTLHGESGASSAETELRETLAAYDDEVQSALEAAHAAAGLDRVRALHNRVHPAVAVHDAILEWALCPLLDGLPGGRDVSDRLRRGCSERAELLRRFEVLTRGVAAANVYPTSGDEIDDILGGLRRSFGVHGTAETAEVGDVLAAGSATVAPELVADRMAREARRAPTRVHRTLHRGGGERARSALSKQVHRRLDRAADWVDAHHGWSDPAATQRSPRTMQVDALKRRAAGAPSTVRELLASYDQSVEDLVGKLAGAGTDEERGEAAHRLCAAITIHDSVLGGVLAPLLDAAPGGAEQAEQLRQGVLQRAASLEAWDALLRRARPRDVYRTHRSEVDAVMVPLVESFEAHEQEGSLQVGELLQALPDQAYRTRSSPLDDFMWPWHSEGPEVLALRMAMWADTSPTRTHPLLIRHPHSRALRSLFHVTDHFRDRWHDTPVERWLFPLRPSRPFADRPVRRR